MAEGLPNQAIRARLYPSGKAVEIHVRAIFTKLGLERAADGNPGCPQY
jgi:DNA-binding NarL/FixJ family response regulator